MIFMHNLQYSLFNHQVMLIIVKSESDPRYPSSKKLNKNEVFCSFDVLFKTFYRFFNRVKYTVKTI